VGRMVSESAPTLVDEIDLSADKGVIKIIKKQGVGDAHPVTGDTVYVHYAGTLEDGSPFDSSRERNQLFSFNVGKGNVIKAWDVGVATMRKGEICQLICKPEYAYGENGSPPKIPKNATLIFEIELFYWEGEDISPDKDKTILKSIQTEGTKFETPGEGAPVEMYVIGHHEGRVFFDQHLTYPVGECTEHGLPEGVDKAIKRFHAGERSLVLLKSRWGYGSKGNAQFSIPPNAEVEFDITCKSFEKQKESWQMNEDEKLEESEKLKAKGTEHFQEGKYKLALSKYKRLVDLLQHETHLEGEKKARRDALYHAAHLNMALCFLKKNETAECIKHCEKVLEENKDNVKALYRRGQAYQHQNDFHEAVADYEQVLRLEPDNKAAQQGIQQCRQQLKLQKEKDKRLYSALFQKMASSKDAEADNKKEEQQNLNGQAQAGDSTTQEEDMAEVDAAKV